MCMLAHMCKCLFVFFIIIIVFLWTSCYLSLQDLVGLVISILLLGDFSLVLLTLLMLYSISLGVFILVLLVLPLGILSPFPAGINALFSHGPRRSAGLARVYALWNITSLINVVSFSPLCFNFMNCWQNWLFQCSRCCHHEVYVGDFS